MLWHNKNRKRFIPYFSWNVFNVFQKFQIARLRYFADIHFLTRKLGLKERVSENAYSFEIIQ